MSNFRDSTLGSVVILAVICFAVTAALAGTYGVTQSALAEQAAIAEAEREAAGGGYEVLPEGSDFEELSGLPEGIVEGQKAGNDAGYVFVVTTKGYGGDMTLTVGMDADGNFAGIEPGENGETQGIGTQALEPTYLEQFAGQSDPAAVDTVAGATVSSTAVHTALELCVEAYNQVA